MAMRLKDPMCEICGSTIETGKVGGLNPKPRAALDIANTRDAWDWPELPPKVHFSWVHWSCSGEDADARHFNLERIDTPRKAMWWTARLSNKSWFKYSDWFTVMAEMDYHS